VSVELAVAHGDQRWGKRTKGVLSDTPGHSPGSSINAVVVVLGTGLIGLGILHSTHTSTSTDSGRQWDRLSCPATVGARNL